MSGLRDKERATLVFLDRVLQRYRAPVVLWSGGKDSMVLLDLARRLGLRCPVIHWTVPARRAKYEWAEDLTRRWNLTVYDWPPAEVYWQKVNGQMEPVAVYLLGGLRLTVPLNTEGWQGRDCLCGVTDFLRRPTGLMMCPWDAVLHGHRGDDVDPALGPVGLTAEVVLGAGAGPDLLFPLRDWTAAEVWEYTELHQVPYQTTRYVRQENGSWAENPDHEANPDWWPVCSRCLDPDGPAAVKCPKLGCEVARRSERTRREAEVPGYIVGKG